MRLVNDGPPSLLDKRWVRFAAIAFAVMLAGLIGGGGYWLQHTGSDKPGDLAGIAQGFVLRRLPDGYVPHFNPPEWSQVRLDGKKAVVTGSLQAVSRQGELVGVGYTVEMTRHPGGWAADRVELTPQ